MTKPSDLTGDDHLMEHELRAIMLDQRARNVLRPGLSELDPKLMRQRASAELNCWNEGAPALALVRDFIIPSEMGGIGVRLYDPNPDQCVGILVYFHGGGWIIGDLDLEDGALRHIAARGGFKILSVDYRLAPEHRFPAAVEDGEAVLRWIEINYAELNIDPSCVAVGGSSAGANIALGTALRVRDNHGPIPGMMALLFGAYSGGNGEYSSRACYGDGRFGLPTVAMELFWSLYLGEDRTHPHAVPLEADLAGMPPAWIVAAELDILSDESVDLVNKLKLVGVPTTLKLYEGGMHGFTHYFRVSPLARRALAELSDALLPFLGNRSEQA
ncbi:MAG: alpha/beta hydrolase [Sphingomonadales bacterium]|nr:alpha/beta hydrolase [Sphingomonadales bacterium]